MVKLKKQEDINKVNKKIAPYSKELESFVNSKIKEYNTLLKKDHNLIGEILKLHFILEQFINRNLKGYG